MAAIFALLTGIQTYHPDSHVGSLSGCVNDVNNMEAYLHKKAPAADLHIIKLLNEQADRASFIDTFTSHLINNPAIQKDDIVFFYYSGHGSYEPSNPAFASSDSEGQDETMVLYDSRCTGKGDLADKELGLLIANIPASANIVVIMDSCHSGSATRAVDDLDTILLGKAKHQPARPARQAQPAYRALTDYLTVNGKGYEQLQDAAGKITVPPARYISLAACDRYEVAYENPLAPEGMFTGMLLQALDAGPTNNSYAQVFEYLHGLLKNRVRKQTPQLEVNEGFNPHTIIFGNAIATGKHLYRAVRENDGTVTVNCGSLHGLKNDAASVKKISVVLHDGGVEKPASVEAVGLDKATLGHVKMTAVACDAAISNSLPAVVFLVKAGKQTQDAWSQLAEQFSGENMGFVYQATQYHDYVLDFTAQQISITEKDTGMLVHGIEGVDAACMQYIFSACKQICAAQQLLGLSNAALAKKDYDKTFKTSFGIELYDKHAQDFVLQEGNELIVYVDEDSPKVPFRVHVSTASATPLYCALYNTSSRFGIKKCTNNINASKISKGLDLPFSDRKLGLHIREQDNEATDYFTLVIAKNTFKDYLISEYSSLERVIVPYEPGEVQRDVVFKDITELDAIDQDWYAETLTIHVRRKQGRIAKDTGFASEKLSIGKDQRIQATVSFSAIPARAKSDHPSQQLQQLMDENDYSIVNISASKSAEPAPSVVWMDHIVKEQDDTSPLNISLHEPPSDNEQIMALTMQDGVVQVLGFGIPNKDNSGYDVAINIVPDENNRQKSLLGSLWFCFVKVALRKDLTKLRQVTYSNGKPEYGAANVPGIIQQGQRVAVLAHGIIGDSGGIAPAMEFLVTEKHYDLILAFDYENLHTKIEDIAEKLQELLGAAGAGPQQPVDIIAHSMGGLVSRYMIEHIEGVHTWVRRLYMFGTPNAGSVFGDIPKLRDWTVSLLTVATNLGGSMLGAAGPVLSAVNKILSGTKVLTISLAEMSDSSDFYKLLNKPEWPVATRYDIIAGNVLVFAPPDDNGKFKKLMEKIKKQIGEWAYSSTKKNDIAVAVDSILQIPAINTDTHIEIPCHHLNYFELDVTMNYFKQLVAKNNG